MNESVHPGHKGLNINITPQTSQNKE